MQIRCGVWCASAALLLCLMATLLAAAPATQPAGVGSRAPGQYKLFFDTTVDGKPSHRPYYLSLPEGASLRNAQGRYPMVIFLHGICEGGEDHQAMFVEAIPPYLKDRADYRQKYPFIFLCPQAPAGRFWDGDMVPFVTKLTEEIIRTYPVDSQRVYLTGLSSGGTGTWNVALARPDLFAAIAPISGRAVTLAVAAQKLRHVPAWINVGGADGDFFQGAGQMTAALRAAGGEVSYKFVPNAGHVIWDEAFLDPELYPWFLRHVRSATAPATQPVR
jgi:predicted peptidase